MVKASAPVVALSDEEIDRYSRQILLGRIGGRGQRAFAAASIVILHPPDHAEAAYWCGLYCGLAGLGRLSIVEIRSGEDRPSPIASRLASDLAARDPSPRIVPAEAGSRVIEIGLDPRFPDSRDPLLIGSLAAVRILLGIAESSPTAA